MLSVFLILKRRYEHKIGLVSSDLFRTRQDERCAREDTTADVYSNYLFVSQRLRPEIHLPL